MGSTHDSNALGFFGLSGMLHTGLAIFVMVFAVDLIKQPPKPNVVQIEIISKPTPVRPEVAVVTEPPPKGEQMKTPTLEKLAPTKTKVTPVAQAQPAAKPQKASVNKTQTTAAAKFVPTVSPLANLTADDISVPTQALESAELREPTLMAAADLEDSATADDFDRVDQESHKQTAAQLKALHADANSESDIAIKEQQQKISALEEHNEQEAKHVAAQAAARRAREKAEASERAQALAAAQAQSSRGASEHAAQKAAAANAALLAQQEADQEAREAAADRAAKLAAKNAQAANNFGTADGSGMRTLEDLRQRPGNKKPEYDQEDRFQKRQGDLRFMAYVTKEGTLTQIKPIKLTGHRTLDLKTLKAIKEWKFYPGQEGWVEIPYIWSLKGAPQEMQGGLRTKVSRN